MTHSKLGPAPEGSYTFRHLVQELQVFLQTHEPDPELEAMCTVILNDDANPLYRSGAMQSLGEHYKQAYLDGEASLKPYMELLQWSHYHENPNNILSWETRPVEMDITSSTTPHVDDTTPTNRQVLEGIRNHAHGCGAYQVIWLIDIILCDGVLGSYKESDRTMALATLDTVGSWPYREELLRMMKAVNQHHIGVLLDMPNCPEIPPGK